MIDKLHKQIDQLKEDKSYLENMVERLNKEMENRITNIKRDSITAIDNKDEHIKSLYTKVCAITSVKATMN